MGATFGYGGFTKNKTADLPLFNTHTATLFDFDPVKDITFGVKSNLSYNITDMSAIDLGLSFDFRHVNDFTYLVPEKFYSQTLQSEYGTVVPETLGSENMGILGVNPKYRFSSGKISGHVGLQLDFNMGGMQKDVHFAPDLNLQWAFRQDFSAYLKATGGEVMNTNASLWTRNPWMTGVFPMERSHVNADIELGVTFGSYKGFWATLHGGWSSVSDWVTPVVIEGVNTWATMNEFHGFNCGLEVGYAWKNLFRVVGHVSAAEHGKYYRWQDNAQWAFDIAAKVRPIDKLQIELGYDSRLRRRGFVVDAVPNLGDGASYVASAIKLGHTSNLFVGAEYEITPALSAFVKCENLLNRHWNLTNYVRSQGVHGLFGVQYKF